MKKGIKKKAFTLTELLVVVVVIGVLSAVVLPKFSKVIETRRTTEAEELMASIRTEQERRCALDKKYITDDISKLNDIVKNPDTKNYRIELASTGIKANRKDATYNYTLQMPSYADGRICCDSESDACQKLNKNYPTCTELMHKTDYQDSPESCAGDDPVPPTPCEIDPNSCECNPNQAKCCPAGTVWNGSSCVTCNDCSCPEYAASHAAECNPEPEDKPKPCTGPKPDDKQPCNDCGEQTRTVTCNTVTGVWETGAWNACNKTKEECTEDEDCCSENFTGDFAECIKKKYGYDSVEYTCASGSSTYSSSWYSTFGSLTGASACAWRLTMGCAAPIIADTGNKTEMCKDQPGYCNDYRAENSAWIAGGFKKYACTGAVPTRGPNTGSSGSGTTCCKVYAKPEKTFTYSDVFGKTNCMNSACGVGGGSNCENAWCPSNIRPGVLMQVNHSGLDCLYKMDCPFDGYGWGYGPYHGVVQKLGCQGSYECDPSEVEWLN